MGWFAITEPEAGSDAASLRMSVRRDGDHYVLNGTKRFITNAPEAGLFTVMARTNPEEKGASGISAFLVEKGMPGFRPGRKENKLGLRASDTAELIFEDCLVPEENLIGQVGEGFRDAMRVLDGGRISIAALALGIARGAFDAAMKYAQQRRQFGKAISEFQAIQFKLADMATEIEAARLLTYKAAWLKDQGRDFTLTAAQAKLKTGRLAVRCTEEAVQIHGGYGFIEEYPVCRFYRDAKILTIGEGTDEVQQMVIARQLGC